MDKTEFEMQAPEESVTTRTLKGISILSVGTFLNALLVFLYNLLLARTMSPKEFGLVSLATSVMTLGAVLSDLRMGDTVVRFVSRYRAEGNAIEVRRVVTEAIKAKSVLGVLVASGFFISADYLGISLFGKPELILPIRVISFSLIGSALLSVPLSTFLGLQKFGLKAILTILKSFLILGIGFSLVYLGYGAIGAVTGIMMGSIVAALVASIILVTKGVPKTRTLGSSSFNMRMLLSYSSWLAISSLLSFFCHEFNTFILGIYGTLAEVAEFRVARMPMSAMSLALMPLGIILLSFQSEFSATKNMKLMRTYFKEASRLATFIYFPLAMIAFLYAESILTLFFSIKYAGTSDIFRLLILWGIVGVMAIGVGPTLIGIGRADLATKAQLYVALTNVIISVVLVPSLRAVGVVLAAIISWSIGLIAGLRYTHIQIHATLPVNFIIKYAIATIMIGFTFRQLTIDSFPYFIGAIPIILLLYFVLVIYLGGVTMSDMVGIKATLCSIPILRHLERFVRPWNALFTSAEHLHEKLQLKT